MINSWIMAIIHQIRVLKGCGLQPGDAPPGNPPTSRTAPSPSIRTHTRVPRALDPEPPGRAASNRPGGRGPGGRLEDRLPSGAGTRTASTTSHTTVDPSL